MLGSQVKLLIGMLAMKRKWALREVKVTSLDGTFTSFFLSFFPSLLTNTHIVCLSLCCDHVVECMHAWKEGRKGWMKASKKAFSYSNMYHLYLSHVFHLFISHSLLSHMSVCYEYVKLVWTSLRMRCVVGWLVYNKAVSVVDTQVVFEMCSINSIAACIACIAC